MKRKETQTAAALYTEANTVRTMYDKVEELQGNFQKVAIISPSFVREMFTEEYRNPAYQLFRLQGGTGIFPERKLDNVCIGYFCADGERCQLERNNFIGIADEATTKYAEELEAKWLDKKTGKKAV